jgi:hypothetical protein
MTSLITSEIQRMAQDALFGELPTQTGSLIRNTKGTKSSIGGDVAGPQTIASFPCRVRQPHAHGEPMVAERIEAQSDVEIVLSASALTVTVKPTDRIRVEGHGGSYDEFEVIGTDGPRTGALAFVVSCVRVKAG